MDIFNVLPQWTPIGGESPFRSLLGIWTALIGGVVLFLGLQALEIEGNGEVQDTMSSLPPNFESCEYHLTYINIAQSDS